MFKTGNFINDVIESNLLVVAQLTTHPNNQLRVIGDYALVHEQRMVTWFVRRVTGDSRVRIINVLQWTTSGINDLVNTFIDTKKDTNTYNNYKKLLLRICNHQQDFIGGIEILQQTYGDVNVNVELQTAMDNFNHAMTNLSPHITIPSTTTKHDNKKK